MANNPNSFTGIAHHTHPAFVKATFSPRDLVVTLMDTDRLASILQFGEDQIDLILRTNMSPDPSSMDREWMEVALTLMATRFTNMGKNAAEGTELTTHVFAQATNFEFFRFDGTQFVRHSPPEGLPPLSFVGDGGSGLSPFEGKALQAALNAGFGASLTIDGAVGKKTLAEVHSAGFESLSDDTALLDPAYLWLLHPGEH
jgi:hypothetical protein